MTGKPLSDKNEQELKRAERQEALSKLDELAEQIASAWRSPKSAVKLLEEQRRQEPAQRVGRSQPRAEAEG